MLRNRSNVDGSIGRIAESSANLRNAKIQSFVEINKGLRSPYGLFKFSTGDDLTGMSKQ